MSRPVKALTLEQVFQCADQLVLEGKNPTIAALRERLGSGSVTTIHKYLSQWKTQQQQKSLSSAPQTSDFPALLRALQAEIDRAVALATTPLLEEIAALKNEAAEWTREIARLESERETLEDQLELKTSECKTLEGRLLGRTEELTREMSLLRQDLEKERKEKNEYAFVKAISPAFPGKMALDTEICLWYNGGHGKDRDSPPHFPFRFSRIALV